MRTLRGSRWFESGLNNTGNAKCQYPPIQNKNNRVTTSLTARVPAPRIGLLPTGHRLYWDQFPSLKAMGEKMYGKLHRQLQQIGEVVAPELVDTPDKARAAAQFFQ
jgi:hypothetical protein